jgi:crossover junction endodeoxyribonuclease RuvC
VEQTSGRHRLNIYGAIDLETGSTRMIDAATVNAISMIMLQRAIEVVQAWLARPCCPVYFGALRASKMFKLVLLVRECDSPMVRLLGIDPGLRFTGWGLIDVDGNRLQHVADGVIATDDTGSVPARLKILHDALMALLNKHLPAEAAVEETYVNRNGAATLKLGYARGVALLTPALAGVPVTEYAAKTVKLSVVGTGGAEKEQVLMMVRRLLPGSALRRSDAADALAVAICHAHHRSSRLAWSKALSGSNPAPRPAVLKPGRRKPACW